MVTESTDDATRDQVEGDRAALDRQLRDQQVALRLFEQALRTKDLELQAAARVKSDLLARMSHELRTPLNAILGFSEVLRDGFIGPLTAQQRELVRDIFDNGKQLLSLVNDILEVSAVEAGRMTLDLEPVEMASLLANSLATLGGKAAARHIRLGMETVVQLGRIEVDPRKVKQIVHNLLSNGVRFTGEGGQVRLHAHRVPRAAVGKPTGPWVGASSTLEASDFAEFLEIGVTDTGIGIAAEKLALLFRPFGQLEEGLARRFEGTGLGLAIVKQLAELHGGAVSVQSALDEGSCFTVWLPLREVGTGHERAA